MVKRLIIPFLVAIVLTGCETTGEGFQNGYSSATSGMDSGTRNQMNRLTRNGRTLPSSSELSRAIDPGAECDSCAHNRRNVLGLTSGSREPAGEIDSNLVEILRRNVRKNCNRDKSWNIQCTGSKSSGKSRGKCYLYVKEALHEAGLVRDHGERHARDAGPHLKKAGYRNILQKIPSHSKERFNAPKGAVLVYGGGDSGHIEVKVSNSEFLSDYNSATDPLFAGEARYLIGVYVK